MEKSGRSRSRAVTTPASCPDPVIVPRAVVVVEAMAALTVADLLLMSMTSRLDKIKKFFKKEEI